MMPTAQSQGFVARFQFTYFQLQCTVFLLTSAQFKEERIDHFAEVRVGRLQLLDNDLVVLGLLVRVLADARIKVMLRNRPPRWRYCRGDAGTLAGRAQRHLVLNPQLVQQIFRFLKLAIDGALQT